MHLSDTFEIDHRSADCWSKAFINRNLRQKWNKNNENNFVKKGFLHVKNSVWANVYKIFSYQHFKLFIILELILKKYFVNTIFFLRNIKTKNFMTIFKKKYFCFITVREIINTWPTVSCFWSIHYCSNLNKIMKYY